ncbi:MAG: ABC transporter ATP-binding protein [Oscillospiraceae bacterium]
MIKLFRYLKLKEWLYFLISLVFIVAQVFLDLKLPDYMSRITTLVETSGSAMGDIWSAGGMMLLCSLGSLASSIIVCFLAARIAASFSKRLRAEMFNKVESFSLEEINAFSTASLITRSTNDVTQVQMLIVISLQVVIKAPTMAVWAVMKIAGKAWQWSLATAITVALLIIILSIAIVLTFPKFRRVQWLQDALNQSARENLTGIRVVRAYNAEDYQEKKFRKANTELLENQLFANRTMTLLSPFMSLSMNCLSMSIYWIGAVLINSIAVESAASVAARVDIFADMIVFMSYAMQVIMSFLMIVMVAIVLPRALEAAKRILEVLETEPRVVSGSLTGAGEASGEVEFKNVCFTYPGGSGEVLSDISFKANKGETVAFIGSTGSGKTTLVNLIPRFYDASAGEVLVDGVNVRDYDLDTLYGKISYVSQKAVMFSGTIADNVAFGANAEPEKLDRAIEISRSADFVSELEEGTDAYVARGGTNFSGGQKQRLSIARALCRDAEILIFDDTFSALDFKTDRQLRDALKSETEGKTKLIVAQRIGTIMSADRIIVLDDGRIAGMGTHKELLKSCEVYRQIALSQLSEEELAI